MSKAPARAPADVDLLNELEDLEDEIPLTPEEEAALLPPPEVLAAGLKKVMQMVEQEQERRAQLALEAGRAEREAVARTLRARVVHRPRAENLARIAALRIRSPAHAQRVAVYYRDFESAPDEDLDLLVADLESLADLK